jgi:hypothetical protein
MDNRPPTDPPPPVLDWPHDDGWDRFLRRQARRAGLDPRPAEPSAPASETTPSRTPAQQALVDWYADDLGRPLTRQEANLVIAQAEMIGEL